ncbi:membrane protein required for colicin V production [Gammaproteobacteria bacterium]
MNWLDYGIIGFILLSTLIGLRRGFTREIFSMIALGLSLMVAFMFSDKISPLFQNYIPLPSMRQIVAFAALLIGMLIVMAILNYILVTIISMSDVGGFDLLLGMVFGIARGVIMVTAFVFLVGFTPFPRDPWWRASRLIPQFETMAHWSCKFLPQELNKLSSFCS